MRLFTNNASTTLASPISNVALSMTVATGDGAKFPNPTGSDYFMATLYRIAAGEELDIEIVKCTARSGDVLTIQRGQEGTTGVAHASGDLVGLRVTAGAMTAHETLVDSKDQGGGIVGLTALKINFKNVLGTFISFFTNSNTAARTYTFQDRDGTIADNTDLDLKADLVSPSFTTPSLGVASTTSINKVVITAPATSATITIANGKTFTSSNTLTFTGTDGSTLNVGAGGTLGTAAYTASTAYAPAAGSASITTVGTIATGTWNGGVVAGQYGGTGVNNTGKTLTLGGNHVNSGAFASTFTFTGATTVTFPTSGTLISTAPSTAGNVLTSDGTNWVSSAPSGGGSGLKKSYRTSNTILGTSDTSSFIDITSGTFTQTFTACSTLGDGWWVYLRNSGTGTITLDPNGSETIDGVVSGVISRNAVYLIQCDGVSLSATKIGGTKTIQVLTSGTSWVCPIGIRTVAIKGVGAGAAGGGSSFKVAGQSGGYFEGVFQTSAGTSHSYAIGAGGSGTGGTTTFAGGFSAAGGVSDNYPAAAGAVTGGSVNKPSTNGFYDSANNISIGGSSPMGTGGTYKAGTSVTPVGYGGGGAGSSSTTYNGADGAIILEY